MPKPTKPTQDPVLYEWDYVDLSVVPDATDPYVYNNFTVFNDGTWVEYTGHGTYGDFTTETGTLKKKEFQQLDALIDQINREQYNQYDIMEFPQDTSGSTTVVDIWNQVGFDREVRYVMIDDAQYPEEYYYSADTQADVQEADALTNYLQVLDARYGDNLA